MCFNNATHYQPGRIQVCFDYMHLTCTKHFCPYLVLSPLAEHACIGGQSANPGDSRRDGRVTPAESPGFTPVYPSRNLPRQQQF